MQHEAAPPAEAPEGTWLVCSRAGVPIEGAVLSVITNLPEAAEPDPIETDPRGCVQGFPPEFRSIWVRAAGFASRQVLYPWALPGRRIVLDPAWSLAGHVVDPEGRPVQGATVDGRSKTDASGAFVLDEIEWDELMLQVSAEGFAPWRRSVACGRTDLLVRLSREEEEPEIPEEEIFEGECPTLAVRVTDADGGPVASRWTCVGVEANEPNHKTDDEGRIRSELYAWRGGSVRFSVEPTAESPGVDLELEPPRPGSAEEILVALPRGVAVHFRTERACGVELTTPSGSPIRRDTSGGGARFVLDPALVYGLCVSGNGISRYMEEEWVAPPGGGDVWLALEPSATVQGRLVHEDGSPVMHAEVEIETRLTPRHSLSTTATTDEAGAFCCPDVSRGDVSLSVHTLGVPTLVLDLRVTGDLDVGTRTVRAPGLLTGHIVDGGGGTRLCLMPYGASTSTRADRSFGIDVPPDGEGFWLLAAREGFALTPLPLTPGPHRLLTACAVEIVGEFKSRDDSPVLRIRHGDREIVSTTIRLPWRATDLPPGPLRFALSQGGSNSEIVATLAAGTTTVLDLSPGRPRVLSSGDGPR